MASVTLTLEEYEALRDLISSERESEGATLAAEPKKKKRKVSKYSKTFGSILSTLKSKHPRTDIRELMEKAHSKTRSELGMPRKKK